MITNNIDICFISETKIDENFPNQQVNISNYKTFRRDRNKHDGGLLFYVNENIPCKLINDEIIPSAVEMVMFGFLVKLENGFALVFTNHHPKAKIICSECKGI